eukprot:gene17123-22144_t
MALTAQHLGEYDAYLAQNAPQNVVEGKPQSMFDGALGKPQSMFDGAL